MMRRARICLAIVSVLSLGCGRPAGVSRIILISVDTLRADHVGRYGYPRDTTPRLDRLSHEGTFFANAISTTSWTLPAHMSMLTGLLPKVHGVATASQRLDPARHLVQEDLREAGFRTAGFVSGPFLDARYGYARGFETYRNFWEDEDAILDEVRGEVPKENVVAELRRRARDASFRDQTGPYVIGAAVEWLDDAAEGPFFLFVHLWEPHYDFLPPAPYDTLFVSADYNGTLSMDDFVHNPDINPAMAPQDLSYLISQYDGEITYTDFLIGQLLDHLEALGIAEETLLIVTSDHGEEFFEHGEKGHHKTLYDEVIHVPLIVSGPGVKTAAAGIDAQVSLVDIAPTILSAAGLSERLEIMGRDLWPLLSSGRSADADGPLAVSQLDRGGRARPGRPSELFSARSLQWKAILSPTAPTEIYDLAEDAAETRNVPAGSADGAAGILSLAETLRDSIDALAASLRRVGTTPVTIDEALEEKLRGLGYVD